MKNNLKIAGMSLMLMSSTWFGIANADGNTPLPQGAYEACSDKGNGDICSFVNDTGDSINGACGYQGGVEGKLVCVPIH